MSMYLPNSMIGPVGAEPGEFLEFPAKFEDLRSSHGASVAVEDRNGGDNWDGQHSIEGRCVTEGSEQRTQPGGRGDAPQVRGGSSGTGVAEGGHGGVSHS